MLDTICPDTESDNEEKMCQSSDPNTKEYLENFKELITDRTCDDYDVVLHDLPTKTNCKTTDPLTCPGQKFTKKDQTYTFCWPKDWLANDCKNIRIIGINYDTSLSMWAPLCPCENVKPNLEQRSRELSEKLILAGVGQRPIVWVTHSMGGLIVKNMLCDGNSILYKCFIYDYLLFTAFESDDPTKQDLCRNTKGIIFYSTPHVGSRIANFSQATALLLWPSVEVQELRESTTLYFI